jgi:hypothetical protein
VSIRLSGAVVEEPPVKAKPSVDLEELFGLHPELLNESYVYVHCHFNNVYKDMLIRIWKTTFLVDRDSPSRSALVHAENITYAPVWTIIPDFREYSFLLIFERLPKSCTVFHLVEEIAQPGAFVVQNISRNEQDVYHVAI